MTTLNPPGALVLLNYECGKSRSFATWITGKLGEKRFGRIFVDPNDPNDGTTFKNPKAWYQEFKEYVDEAWCMIAVFSREMLGAALPNQRPELNGTPTSYKGIALSSEILHFWSEMRGIGSTNNQLIPVLLDCAPTDLARPKGEFEQLQDIVVPVLVANEPLLVETDSFWQSPAEMEAVAQRIAERFRLWAAHVNASTEEA